MIRINDNGFKLVSINKPIFKSNNTFKDQIIPLKNGNMDNVMTLLNLSDDNRFLTKVYLCSLFIPNIAKYSLILTSEKGTGKSTITRIIKAIVDPSPTEMTKISKSSSELEKRLANCYLPCFDNIDNLTTEQSNALSRAITGDTYEKSNNDYTYVSSYIRPIVLNGIKCPAFKEDLLDRFIILEPMRIYEKDRLNDDYIDSIVKEELPSVLADIFNTIAKARVLKKNGKLLEKDRMANSYEWCYFIAEAIEPNGGKRFQRIIKENRNNRNSNIINNNQLALALKIFVNKGGIGSSIEMKSEELYKEIKQTAWENNLLDKFPKGSNWFIRDLKGLIGVLEKEGIKVETDIRKNDANYVKITRILKE